MAFDEVPQMSVEFRVVYEEHDGVDNRGAVGEDVQNIKRVLEVKLFLAIAEDLNDPHDMVRQQEDGKHDDISDQHAQNTPMTVTATGAFRVKDSESVIKLKEICHTDVQCKYNYQ